MPWKAANNHYQCTRCDWFLGTSQTLTKEQKVCPRCAAPTKKIRCKHERVEFYANSNWCEKCHGIVNWVD